MNGELEIPELPFLTSAQLAPGKARILVAALTLFVRKGLCETSIRDIAQVAGYTNPALYKHFAGKDDLALHLFELCHDGLGARLSAAVRRKGGPRARLSAFLHAYLAAFDAAPEAVLYVQQHMQRFWPLLVPQAGRQARATALLHELVADCARADGAASAEDVELVTVMIMGALNRIVHMIHLGEMEGPASHWADDLDRRVAGLLGCLNWPETVMRHRCLLSAPACWLRPSWLFPGSRPAAVCCGVHARPCPPIRV